jgi:hypothetical protein
MLRKNEHTHEGLPVKCFQQGTHRDVQSMPPLLPKCVYQIMFRFEPSSRFLHLSADSPAAANHKGRQATALAFPVPSRYTSLDLQTTLLLPPIPTLMTTQSISGPLATSSTSDEIGVLTRVRLDNGGFLRSRYQKHGRVPRHP